MCNFTLKSGKQCSATIKADGTCKYKSHNIKKIESKDVSQIIVLSEETSEIEDMSPQSNQARAIEQTIECEKISEKTVAVESASVDQGTLYVSSETRVQKLNNTKDFFEQIFDMGTGGPIPDESIKMDHSFCETFDRNKLAFILNNLDEIKKKYRPSARDSLSLDKYYLQSKQDGLKDGKLIVKYYQSHKDTTRGRLQAAGSLSGQGMVREVRHTIFDDYYVDMDMDNCHPVITVWMCERLDIDCEHMKEYVANREKHSADIIELNPDMTRDACKSLFLSISYGGIKSFKSVKNKTPFLKDYFMESGFIKTELCEVFKYFKECSDKVKADRGGDFNLHGAAVANICQYVENRMLMLIVKYLKSKDVDITDSILCFDGIMIRKDAYDSSYLADIEGIFSNLGINMKMSKKTMAPLDLSEFGFNEHEQYKFVQESDVKRYNTFDDDAYYWNDLCHHLDKTEFNKSSTDLIDFLVENLPRVLALVNDNVVIKQSSNQYFEVRKFKGFSTQLVHEYYMQQDPKTGEQKIVHPSPRELWRVLNESKKHFKLFNHTLANYHFNNDESGTFIASRRFAAKQIDNWKSSSLDTLLSFVKTDLFSENDVMFNYELDKLAIMCKYPHLKTEICTLLISGQGCGKNLYTDFLCDYVFGSYNCISNMPGVETLLDDKNGEQFGKKFIVVNEMSATKDKFMSNFNKLKGMVTEKSQRIRMMNMNGFMVEQATEYYCLSNHKNSYVIESEKSRREFVPDISEKHADDRVYWGPIRGAIKNQDCGNSFYSMLLARPITYDEFMAKKVPMSKTKREIVNNCKSDKQLFIEDLRVSLDKEEAKYQASTLYNKYKAYCEANGCVPESLKRLVMTLNQLGFYSTKECQGKMYTLTRLEDSTVDA